VRWDYNWQPEPETAEAELYEVFLKPRDWATTPGDASK
jgi:coproporphyrinogen III oxidase